MSSFVLYIKGGESRKNLGWCGAADEPSESGFEPLLGRSGEGHMQ